MTDRPPVGARVELVWTYDEYTSLVPGDRGTVTGHGPDPLQLWIDWDNGSSLALIIGHDRFRVVESGA